MEQVFSIKFGKGRDSVCQQVEAADCLAALQHLKSLGWEVENITSIKRIN